MHRGVPPPLNPALNISEGTPSPIRDVFLLVSIIVGRWWRCFDVFTLRKTLNIVNMHEALNM